MIQIRPVLTAKDLMAFIMLPFRLYENDPHWVAPLIREQKKFFNPELNSYHKHSEVALFLAWEGDRPIGRISAHTNTQHNLVHKDKVGFFGFFECEDNQNAANLLLQTALDWNKTKGMDTLRGPMNFSINNECGMLIDGFDTPPFLMMTHHPPYYGKLLDNAGFGKAKDLYAYYLDHAILPPKVETAAKYVMRKSSFTVRTLSTNKKKMQADIQQILQVHREAWQYNWGAIPLTEAELDQLVKELLPLAVPELVLIAELDGRPVGFSLALPNYNEVLKVMRGKVNPLTMLKAYIKSKQIHSARVLTMGVVREYQNRGIDIVFLYYSFKNALAKGITCGEFSWVLEDNVMMVREAEMLNARIHKTYRIYDKAIV